MEIIKWGNNLFIKNLDDDTYTRVFILGECVGTKHTIEDIENLTRTKRENLESYRDFYELAKSLNKLG